MALRGSDHLAEFGNRRGSARRNDPIEVVDYDPAWPEQFASWRTNLRAQVGDFATRIEHVGSTSVPGLAAKPRIDIRVCVPDLTREDRYVIQIEAAGAQRRSRDDSHRYFRSLPGRPRVLQVHDGVGYTDAEGGIILDILDRAKAWQQEVADAAES